MTKREIEGKIIYWYQNLRMVEDIQNNIINQYKADFSKYEKEDKKLRLHAIYDNVPSQLDKQNNRFIFTHLDKELKFDRYENSFLWLKDAGVVLPTYIAKSIKSPLVISKSKNIFKLFLSDVGLLTSTFPDFTRKQILEINVDNSINNGSLFENFVAESLVANSLTPYYYKSTKIGEIDFLVEKDGVILPIEVKSIKEFKKHKSLDKLIQQSEYRFEWIIKQKRLLDHLIDGFL